MEFIYWAYRMKKRLTWALSVQIFSGIIGLILALTIRKARALVVAHSLFVIFAIIGIYGFHMPSLYPVLFHAYATAIIGFALFLYQSISTAVLELSLTDIFLSSPFFVDFVIGCICLYFVLEYYKGLEQPIEAAHEEEADKNADVNARLLPIVNCCICQDRPAIMVVCRCGHRCLCDECANVLVKGSSKCPICRKVIADILHVYE